LPQLVRQWCCWPHSQLVMHDESSALMPTWVFRSQRRASTRCSQHAGLQHTVVCSFLHCNADICGLCAAAPKHGAVCNA
jgi:hypothetical protein